MPGECDSVFGARALQSALPAEVCAGRLGELGSGGERSVPARCVVLGVPVAGRRVPLLPAPADARPPGLLRGGAGGTRAQARPRHISSHLRCWGVPALRSGARRVPGRL